MRILVLRPAEASARTATELARRGHKPVVAPILTIEPTGAMRPGGTFDGLLVTSAHAVPELITTGGDLRGTRVFAVGTRAADALAAAGLGPARTAPDAAALARLVADEVPPGRLLHAAGRDRKAEPAATLVRSGFEVVVWEVYRARAAEILPFEVASALAENRLDAVLHYSRASAAAALALVRAAGHDAAFARLVHACLSDDVAQGLAGLAPAVLTIAAQPDEAHLIDLLEPVPISG